MKFFLFHNNPRLYIRMYDSLYCIADIIESPRLLGTDPVAIIHIKIKTKQK
jgi:hypothetical protein